MELSFFEDREKFGVGVHELITHAKDPDRKSTRHIVEATIGGLAVNQFANGPRNLTRS